MVGTHREATVPCEKQSNTFTSGYHWASSCEGGSGLGLARIPTLPRAGSSTGTLEGTEPSQDMSTQGAQVKDKLPTCSSSGRKMKRRRNKGGSTSPIQKWNHKLETFLHDLRHEERQDLLLGDLDRLHDFLDDLHQTSGSERRLRANGSFFFKGQWCPKDVWSRIGNTARHSTPSSRGARVRLLVPVSGVDEAEGCDREQVGDEAVRGKRPTGTPNRDMMKR